MKRKPKVPLREFFVKELAFIKYMIILVICIIIFKAFKFDRIAKSISIFLLHHAVEIVIVILVLIVLFALYYVFMSISKSRRLILTDNELKELKIHSFEDYVNFINKELGDYELYVTDTLYNFMQSMLDKKLIIMNLSEITKCSIYFNKFAVYEYNTFVQDSEILLVCRDAHIQTLNEKYMTKVENFAAHNDYFTGHIDNKHCVCHLLNEIGNFKRSRGNM
jgi:hypothetical protein